MATTGNNGFGNKLGWAVVLILVMAVVGFASSVATMLHIMGYAVHAIFSR